MRHNLTKRETFSRGINPFVIVMEDGNGLDGSTTSETSICKRGKKVAAADKKPIMAATVAINPTKNCQPLDQCFLGWSGGFGGSFGVLGSFTSSRF
jgi:hypothetical protein